MSFRARLTIASAAAVALTVVVAAALAYVAVRGELLDDGQPVPQRVVDLPPQHAAGRDVDARRREHDRDSHRRRGDEREPVAEGQGSRRA